MSIYHKDQDILLISVGIGKGLPIFKKRKLFMVTDNYCTNPDCLCRSVRLFCHELDKNCNPADSGIQFAFSLNIDNWSAEMIDCPEEIKGHVKCIIDAMLRRLTYKTKKRFKERYETAKNPNYHIESFSDLIDIEDINSGLCVGYNDIFDDNFKFSAPFIHNYGGRTFCFYDRYCINPRCQCNEALLTAICKDMPKLVKDEYFVVRFQIGRERKYNIEESECSQDETMAIFNSWLSNSPNINETLKERYKRVKHAGKYIVEKKELVAGDNLVKVSNSSNKKIGRNDPCPCGSGKKYKKCCG